MTSRVEIDINLDKIAEIGRRSAKRAAMFMGLGLNAMHREDVNDYQLHKLPILPEQSSLPIDFIPTNLSKEVIGKAKTELS